ncbi:MAG: c-type cytochrome biogenesis protein CcmI [Geminicoccaceae bacterium]|nr:c-type cytochrome biogenesis protein CcmI [Geminicoccaceae bacterium]
MNFFWWTAAGFAALAMLLLLAPLLSRKNRTGFDSNEEVAAALAVCRDQLHELDRERDERRINAEEARAARIEIERRMLAIDERKRIRATASPLSAALVAVTAALVPAVALLIYLSLGDIGYRDMPFASRETANPHMQAADADAMLQRTEELQERLESGGGTAQEWWLLGQSQQILERFDKAAEAYRKAAELDPGNPAPWGAYGEALVHAAGGTVNPDAGNAFRHVLDLQPDDPRARYYTGLAAAQNSEFEDALTIWQELYRDSPADAPWMPTVHDGLVNLANSLGRDPAVVIPEPRPAQVAAAPQADPAGSDPDALRRKLEASPKDFQGWLQLARLEMARGNDDAARQAITRVKEVYKGAPFVQQQIARAEQQLFDAGGAVPRGPTAEQVAAAQQMTPDEQKDMIRGMVSGLADRLDSEPGDLQGWIMLMRSYGVLDERDAAMAAYERARSHFRDDEQAQARLDEQARAGGLIR